MLKEQKRIVILTCCGERFSKIVEDWSQEPVVGEWNVIKLNSIHECSIKVKNILPIKSCSNPYEFDVVFAKSSNEHLFSCLCDLIGTHGWFEKEEVTKNLRTN